MHASIPDVWSLPLNEIPTGPVYQPFTSAARAGWPPVATGGVLSTLIVSSTVTVAVPSLALQNSFVPAVSVVNVLSWQPLTAAPEGSTVQSIDTFDRYQPEHSCGAGEHVKLTLGTASARTGPKSSSSHAKAKSAAERTAHPGATATPQSTAVLGRSPRCALSPMRHLSGREN